MRRASLLAILAAAAVAAEGTDEAPATSRDGFHLLAGVQTAYEITETATVGNATTTYDWNDTDDYAAAFGVGWTRAIGGTPTSEPIVGAEFLFGSATLEPGSFGVDGSSYPATVEQFDYQTYTASAIGGWRWRFPGAYALTPVIELQGHAGLTLVDASVDLASGTYATYGKGFDLGLRAMVGLSERNFTLGVATGWNYGYASFSIKDKGENLKSDFDLERNGLDVMAVGIFSF